MSDVKNYTLFFVGGAKWDVPDYSHGVRQTLFRLFNDTPGESSTCTRGLHA